VVVTVGSINLIYQFWVHTQHIGKLGWYEWIFVTPSNHRVHHAQNERYVDRNYGGLFIIWDRLFGTFQEELEDDPPVYGIRGPLHSWNPLRALTHIYVDMFATAGIPGAGATSSGSGWPAPAGVRRCRGSDPRPKADLSTLRRPSIRWYRAAVKGLRAVSAGRHGGAAGLPAVRCRRQLRPGVGPGPGHAG
jgi:alkylglycerol monooxygenase